MKLVIAVERKDMIWPQQWDLMDKMIAGYTLGGEVIEGAFVLQFDSWDIAAQSLRIIADRVERISSGKESPDQEVRIERSEP